MPTLAVPPPAPVVHRLLELADRAPSVHNTQPWRWRLRGGVLELEADLARQLVASDPDGRNLVISCGAALHHARVAARALGWSCQVELLGARTAFPLLARVHLSPAEPAPHSGDLVATIEQRCTDRRRFTSWPVPDERLTHLGAEAAAWGVRAYPIVDLSDRFRTELLVRRARDHQRGDAAVRAELAAWTTHTAYDGVPAALRDTPAEERTAYPDRFQDVEGVTRTEVIGSDGLVVLGSADDDATAWLRAGQALSALWLRATDEGMTIVPLSQVVEVESTRTALRHDVLGGAHPLVLVRVGWRSLSRHDLPRTPRRPVEDVLVTVEGQA